MENVRIEVFIIILVNLLSCNMKTNQELEREKTQVKILEVNPSIYDYKSISDIFQDITVTKINTDSENLIGEISKIISINDFYFLLDQGPKHAVYCVNNSGEIVYKIQNIGEGLGEFLNIKNFSLNIEEQKIKIYTPGQRKILEFDMNTGDFLKEHKIENVFAIDFIETDEFYYWYNDGAAGLNPNNLIITNKKFEIENEFIKYSGPQDIIGKSSNFYKNNNDILFYYGLSDTIFYLNQNKYYPRLYIDFGDFEIKHSDKEGSFDEIFEKLNERKNHAGFIYNLVENKNFIFFMYSFNFNPQFVLYNKNDDSLKNSASLNNDINGIKFPIPSVGRFSTPITLGYNGDLVTLVYPFQLYEILRNHHDEVEILDDSVLKEITDIISNTKDTDNLIILNFKWK